MSQETLTIKDIIKWCDEQVEQGFELQLCWEGGGDSGWCWFQIDREQCTQPEAEWLVDKMYETLDYGSWAGEYSANGEATYNAETKQFDGTDYYSEDDSATHKTSNPYVFKIPKSIHFDDIFLECEGEEYVFNMNVHVRNGFFDKSSGELFAKIEKELNEWSEAMVAEIQAEDSSIELQSCWDNYEISKDEFTVTDTHYEYALSDFSYRLYNTTENGINIDLLELLENEELD